MSDLTIEERAALRGICYALGAELEMSEQEDLITIELLGGDGVFCFRRAAVASALEKLGIETAETFARDAVYEANIANIGESHD